MADQSTDGAAKWGLFGSVSFLPQCLYLTETSLIWCNAFSLPKCSDCPRFVTMPSLCWNVCTSLKHPYFGAIYPLWLHFAWKPSFGWNFLTSPQCTHFGQLFSLCQKCPPFLESPNFSRKSSLGWNIVILSSICLRWPQFPKMSQLCQNAPILVHSLHFAAMSPFCWNFTLPKSPNFADGFHFSIMSWLKLPHLTTVSSPWSAILIVPQCPHFTTVFLLCHSVSNLLKHPDTANHT